MHDQQKGNNHHLISTQNVQKEDFNNITMAKKKFLVYSPSKGFLKETTMAEQCILSTMAEQCILTTMAEQCILTTMAEQC